MTRRYEERIRERNPRELTYQFELGGRKLLAIFGVVAVVCGLFFGLGYTIGRHKVPATFTLGGSVNATNTAKLAAGTPLAPPAPVPSASVAPPTTNDLTAAEASQTSQPLQPTAAATPTPAAATASMAGILAACKGVRPPSESCGSSAQPSGMMIAYFIGIRD